MNYLLVLSFLGNMISFEKTLQDIKGIMYMYASPTNIHVPYLKFFNTINQIHVHVHVHV